MPFDWFPIRLSLQVALLATLLALAAGVAGGLSLAFSWGKQRAAEARLEDERGRLAEEMVATQEARAEHRAALADYSKRL